MRTVTLGMNVSLDGFVSSIDGELDWAFPNFSPELMAGNEKLLGGLDIILMGRKNYESQAGTWPTLEGPLADVMNNVKKLVFSNTMKTAAWNNTTVATGAPEEEIARLKALPGGPIGVAGGVQFAQYLLARGLVDEFRLTTHPVMLGTGLPIFTSRIAFDIVSSVDYPHGVTVRTLRPKSVPAGS